MFILEFEKQKRKFKECNIQKLMLKIRLRWFSDLFGMSGK